jgi:hypothetical protein
LAGEFTEQEKEALMPTRYKRLSKDDAALLLVDHQSGLISLVQDFQPGEFKGGCAEHAAAFARQYSEKQTAA